MASGVNPKKVLVAAGICALAACLCGIGCYCTNPDIGGSFWTASPCLAAGWFYVGGKHPYGYHYLGEVFVFIFFGLVGHLWHYVRLVWRDYA